MEILEILEQKIYELVETVNDLKKTNEELTTKLREKEEETRGLKREMDSLLGEKDQVKQKVAHLIKCVEAL
ncbi:MAG TPA: cell division protein ZapB [Desulfomonilia bacterium]|nr:cell division protein ZapB [Thermodesulfobacteriota bacterium]HWR69285.1 cell division protein ZapB [Desulfomonilia bacterium]